MRYNNKRNFQKKDKYNKELGGMTVSVRQVKNKDGETVSDVNGALRVLKKRMMKDDNLLLFVYFLKGFKTIYFNKKKKFLLCYNLLK